MVLVRFKLVKGGTSLVMVSPRRRLWGFAKASTEFGGEVDLELEDSRLLDLVSMAGGGRRTVPLLPTLGLMELRRHLGVS